MANNVPVDELVQRRPDLEQLLVLASLSIPEGEPPVDNSFLDAEQSIADGEVDLSEIPRSP